MVDQKYYVRTRTPNIARVGHFGKRAVVIMKPHYYVATYQVLHIPGTSTWYLFRHAQYGGLNPIV